MNRPTLEGASQIVGHASDTVSPRNRDFSLRRFRIGKGGIGFSPPGEIARSSLVVPDDYPVAFVLVSARLAEYLRRRRKRRNPALDRLDPRLSCRPPQPANSRNPLPPQSTGLSYSGSPVISKSAAVPSSAQGTKRNPLHPLPSSAADSSPATPNHRAIFGGQQPPLPIAPARNYPPRSGRNNSSLCDLLPPPRLPRPLLLLPPGGITQRCKSSVTVSHNGQ